MSNKLRQPRIAAQCVRNRPRTLRPPRSKSQNSRRTCFVVAPLSFLNGHVCCTLPGSPRERNACTTSGIPPRRSSLFEWLGSTSNSKGTRLVKALAFGACRPSYANRAPYGCRFLSTRVLLSWSLLCLSMGLTLSSPPTEPSDVIVIDRSG